MEREQRERIVISISKELLRDIDEMAKKTDISRASLIRKYCSEGLNRDTKKRDEEL